MRSYWFSLESAQTNAIVRIPIAHIGKNNHVARVQPLEDLHRVDGGASQLDVDPHGVRTVAGKFEQADGGFRLAVHRPADVENVLQIFQFDGAVHGEIGARTSGKQAGELHVHGD